MSVTGISVSLDFYIRVAPKPALKVPLANTASLKISVNFKVGAEVRGIY